MKNPLHTISAVNESISRAVSTVSTNKEKVLKFIVNTILLLTIFGITGCLDFAKPIFHFENLVSPSYWAATASRVGLAIASYNLGINLIWDIELTKDYALETALSLYEKLKKHIQKRDFYYFVDNVLNPELKKQAYINRINHKIYRLDRWAKNSDKLLYGKVIPEDAENYDEAVKELEEKKAANKYCCRKKELESLKSDEYIAKNLDNLDVKFSLINPILFFLELDGKEPRAELKVKGNVGAGRAKLTGNVVFGVLIFSMFSTSIGLELNREQFVDQLEAFMNYLIKCLMDIGVILWQLFRGTGAARKLISGELTQPALGRIRVLEKYFEWQLKKGHIDEEKYKSIIKQTEILKISKEDLEKIKQQQAKED